MNVFVEGLQGSGKSTLVRRICEMNRCYAPVMEGEYSPVELAWCAYVREDTYSDILDRYSSISSLIEENTFREGDKRIICYTRIGTDVPGFYSDLEQYEIYNGRIPYEEFRSVLLTRYRNWHDDGKVYECSLLQNTVEDMILFRQKDDDAILGFYRDIRQALEGKQYRLIYLETEDIRSSIGTVRRERVDGEGNERWFSEVMKYFNESAYAKAHGLRDFDGFAEHLEHRQQLELRICREIFPERSYILRSKQTDDRTLETIICEG